MYLRDERREFCILLLMLLWLLQQYQTAQSIVRGCFKLSLSMYLPLVHDSVGLVDMQCYMKAK